MAGFRILYAPAEASSVTGTKQRTTLNVKEGDYVITAADIVDGAYYRLVESGARANDRIVITDIDEFATALGLEVGELISLNMYIQNAGSYTLLLPSTKTLPGISYYGDIPAELPSSAFIKLNFLYVKLGMLVVGIDIKRELKL